METEIAVALVGVGGAIFGAVLTQLFTRRKTEAEIDKIRAETEKAKAEADKLKAEVIQLVSPATNKRGDNPPIDDIYVGSLLDSSKPGEYQERPSPDEIASAIKNLPELQKAPMLEGYKDIRIRWRLVLLSLNSDGDDVKLSFADYQSMVAASCRVRLKDFPKIKILKVGDKASVSGKIANILYMSGVVMIELSECILDFD